MLSDPQLFVEDTIYAVSTGGGRAAIAIVRVSGPQTDLVLRKVCGRAIFDDRCATLARIFDEQSGLLDRALIVRFVAPRSYTGEEMVEFHVTGGRAVVSGLVSAIKACPGTRPAEAGEFARRAFLNGKVDLTEIEGLASVVEAETSAQLRCALSMASGELSRRFEQVRNVLLSAIAQTEAMLDFSDVEDAGDILLDSILHSVREAEVTLDAMLRSSKLSERLRNGLNVVIAGPPNVGKSTLLNFLAQRDIAIVSPFPGTTRDTLEIAANLSGFPVNFVDTAGIRDAVDPVEMEGVARAIQRCASADLILWLSDSDGEPPPQVDAQWPLISVRTKADLLSDFDERRLYISAKNGRGIDALLAKIIDFAQVHFSGIDHATLGTERQIDAAEKALTALRSVIDEPDRQLEFLAEDLRIAAVAISRITGRIEVDEVLNEIFSRLCVGK